MGTPKPGLRAAWWAAIKLGPSISLHMLPMMAACDSRPGQGFGIMVRKTLRGWVMHELGVSGVQGSYAALRHK